MDKQKEKSVRTLLEQRREQYQKEEEAHKKELEDLERQVKMEDGKEIAETMMTVVCSDDHVLERLGDFSVEEGKQIGKRIAINIDDMINKSMSDINALREKKAARDAKRKERQAQKKAKQSSVNTDHKVVTQTELKPEPKPSVPVVQTPVQQAQPTVQRPAQPQGQNVQRPVQGYGNPGQQVAAQPQPNGGIRYVPGAQQ